MVMSLSRHKAPSCWLMSLLSKILRHCLRDVAHSRAHVDMSAMVPLPSADQKSSFISPTILSSFALLLDSEELRIVLMGLPLR